MQKGMVFIFLVGFFLINFISAEIFINNNLNQVYNVGDFIFLNVSLEKNKADSGFMESFLRCNKTDFLVDKRFVSLDSGILKKVFIKFPLFFKGNCSIKMNFSSDSKTSDIFRVSNKIFVDFSMNGNSFFPLEIIKINGSAKKENGDFFNGTAFIDIGGIVNHSVAVKNGDFFYEFKFKKDVFPKKYPININVIETGDSGIVLNRGSFKKEIQIKPKPTSILILSNESLKPPMNFSFKVILLDQANQEIESQSIILKLFNPEGDIVFNNVIISGGEANYFFKGNDSRGAWNLRAYYGNLNSLKQIYVQENRKIFVRIFNNSLKIHNIGNINYIGNINVVIKNSSGNLTIPFNVSLGVGEIEEHNLDIKGVYNISVIGDNSKISEFYNFPFTGAVISNKLNIKKSDYLLIILFILVIFGSWIYHKYNFSFKNLLKLNKTLEKRVYIGVFEFERDFDFKETTKLKKMGFKKINSKLYFLLFYSSNSKSGKKLFKIAKDIKKISKKQGVNSRIVLHSDKFENSVSFLKHFASISKQMLKFSEGKILVSKPIFDSLNLDYKSKKVLTIENKLIEVFLV